MVLISQSLVIQAHQVQDRRVQVIDVHALVDAVVSKIVRHAVRDTALDSTTGHPHAKSMVVVLPSIAILSVRGSTELAAP